MILSELKKQVDFLCDTGHGDNPVLVTLSESSIGSRAATGIMGIYSGFDWEHGQKSFRLHAQPFHICIPCWKQINKLVEEDEKEVIE